MCNTIKDLRPYRQLVSLFRDFLAEHGDEYRTADPNDEYWIRTMGRKFNPWLHVLSHAEDITASS